MPKDLLLMHEHREWFSEVESTLVEDPMNTAKMTTKDLEEYINLIHKAVAGFEKPDSNFENSSTVYKNATEQHHMLQRDLP